jgi:hypothetical protein
MGATEPTFDDALEGLDLPANAHRIKREAAELGRALIQFSAQISALSDATRLAVASGPEEADLIEGQRPCRETRAPLPDPRLLRKIIRQRQRRAHFFDDDLFVDPAWNILLDLTIARAEHKRVSVSSACIASGAPMSTALRWIAELVKRGLLERTEDDIDRRRAFISLSDGAADAMARYFAEQ